MGQYWSRRMLAQTHRGETALKQTAVKVRVQVQLKEMLEALRGEVYRLMAALEVIKVQMYKLLGLRASRQIHHKEKDLKVDHSKVVPNKLDLSKVEIKKAHLNKVELKKAYLNKVDLNKTHPNKMDPSRVDQCKVVLNRYYIRKAGTEGEVSSKE